jgi:putative nucleotidyltransferase with HDIG domain
MIGSIKKLTQKKPGHQTRVNYEDHSQKFLDWVDHLGWEKTWFGRWVGEIEDRYSIRRGLMLFLFCFGLSYLIFFQIQVPFNHQVGDVSTVDINSPMSFEMVDEVTTEEKRLRAEYSIPVVYDYDVGVFDRLQQGISRGFRNMRTYGREVKWPTKGSAAEVKVREFFTRKMQFEKDLGVSVPDYLFEWLIDDRFNPRIEVALVSNLRVWYEKRIADSPDRFIPSHQKEVVARTVNKNNTGKEFYISKMDILDIQNPEPFMLYDKKSLEKFSESDKVNLLYFARSLLIPNLTLNKQETASRKQAARDAILPVNISIKRNQSILTKGTTVQPFHMAIIKQFETLQSDRKKDLMALAMALLLFVSIFVFASYIRRFSTSRVRVEFKDMAVMMLIATAIIVVTKIFLFVADAALLAKFSSALTPMVFLYAVPAAAGPMLIGLLIQSGEVVWLFTAFLSICLGVMEDFNLAWMLVTLIGGIAAARGVYSCKKRDDIYIAGLRTGVINAILITFVLAITRMDQDFFTKEIAFTIIAGFLSGLISSFLALTFVPLLETLFHYTTDVKLLELSNLNHPLLKEMIVKAPGTYHHSMLVGSMVEAAAEEIGANPLLGKVMCYYHDIGKMEHSNYFIENQKQGQNPHDHISPFMSKTLLIAHVKDGVEMGMTYKLGKPIIDGIIQHHGTTLISYFYNKALDMRNDEDPEFSDEEFRYPGPKPQFREAALCMLADSIEAASRSLDEPTPQRLQNIVRNIIQRKFSDGQLDECNLNLKDITKIENAFIRILLGIYHQRIDYPRSAGGGLGEQTSAGVKI